MRTAYKTLAYLIAAEVVIQAAAIVFAISGLFLWIENDGGVADKAALDSDNPFPEVTGFVVHGINGMMVIPALALVLLILSFFVKAPGAVKWAGFVLLAVVVQVALGMFLHSVSWAGLLHGANALVLFSVAVIAGRRMPRSDAAVEAPAAERADVV